MKGAAIALALLTTAGVALAEGKVGVVDVQRAMLATEEGLKAAATLDNYTKKRQSEFDALQEDLLKEQEDIRRQERVLSRRALQRRYEHYQRRMVAFQTKYVETTKDAQSKQQQLIGPIMQKLVGAIRRAASRKGIDIVVDKAAVPWADASLDLTDLTVQIYNSGDTGDEKEKKE